MTTTNDYFIVLEPTLTSILSLKPAWNYKTVIGMFKTGSLAMRVMVSFMMDVPLFKKFSMVRLDMFLTEATSLLVTDIVENLSPLTHSLSSTSPKPPTELMF